MLAGSEEVAQCLLNAVTGHTGPSTNMSGNPTLQRRGEDAVSANQELATYRGPNKRPTITSVQPSRRLH